MNHPLPLVIPVSPDLTAKDAHQFVQDITNGDVAALMTHAELAEAVMNIASDLNVFSMNYALLDEAARRLAPELFELPKPPTILQRLAGLFEARKAQLGIVAVGMLAALLLLSTPAAAANLSDPPGYRRCKLTEIQADPTHKVCFLKQWSEPRNGGGRVSFLAYVRRIK